MNGGRKSVLLCVMAFLMTCTSGFAHDGEPQTPQPHAKCPVCGMFVAKYPDWVAQIQFTDGTTVFFDGAKDLFKFYFGMKQYQPRKAPEDIKAMFFTEFYRVQPIEGRTSFFVIGSDVLGPMGRELIPFDNIKNAEQFMADHQGKRVLKFEEVGAEIIQSLDQ